MRSPLLPITSVALLASASAQQLQSGYSTNLRTLPVAASNVLVLPAPTGGTVWFDGNDLVWQPSTGPTHVLLPNASQWFAGFTALIDAHHVLFGAANGDVWLVPLPGRGLPRFLANLPLCYDAVVFAPGLALVSAKTGGFTAADNDIIAIDVASGATRWLARLPGASGPVEVDPAGNLLYATASLQFPPPAGGTSVLRFRRDVVDTALRQQHVLTIAQADVVATGLDAAGDLVCDADFDLFCVDWIANRVIEIDDIDRGNAARRDLLFQGATGPSIVTLQLLPGTSSAQFEPLQPAGDTLWIHEASFGASSQLRGIQAQRPVTAVPATIPAGAFAVTTTAGPPHGQALVAVGLAPSGPEATLAVGGFEQLLWWQPAMQLAIGTFLVAFDARGQATLQLVNPGLQPAILGGVQVACVDAAMAVVGSAAPVTLVLSR